MNYANIKFCDIANGEGVRTSLFVSGCTHHCKNCFNPETWDFRYGQTFTDQTIKIIIDSLAPSYINGLTLLGGEPLEKVNQIGILPLLKAIKSNYKDKTIWCYTGYLFEDFLPNGKMHTNYTNEILSLIDIMVDGEFVEDLKDISLRFKGSSNQRIIDVQKSLKENRIILSLFNEKR